MPIVYLFIYLPIVYLFIYHLSIYLPIIYLSSSAHIYHPQVCRSLGFDRLE